MNYEQLDHLVNVKRSNAKFSFIGVDAHCYTFALDKPIPRHIYKVMPNKLKDKVTLLELEIVQ